MRAEDWVHYHDEHGQAHTDWVPEVHDQQSAEAWAKKGGTDENGVQKNVDAEYVGKTGVVANGYTDANGKTQPYVLNADGTATDASGNTVGKPATRQNDASNTEPQGASPTENTALVVGTGSEILSKGLEQGEKLASDAAKVAEVGSNEAAQLAGVAQQAKLLGTTLKGVSVVGTAISIGSATLKLVQNPTAGNATRLAVQGAAVAAGFIPVVGWGVSLGIVLADAVWGDEFYNWIDKH